MARFIDSDKSICQVQNNDKYGTITKQVFISLLQNSETEDVVPVVHAHWIEEEDCTAVTDIPWSMCSACGSYSLKLPYCAFCGAKMDEVINDA